MRGFRTIASACVCAGVVLAATPAAALPIASPGEDQDAGASRTGQLADQAAAHQQALADGLVKKAKGQVAEAEQQLADARDEAARLRDRADHAADRATDARRDLGNMARAAYAAGGSDMAGLASLVDSPDPANSMRRAVVAELVADHQDSQVVDANKLAADAEDLHKQADGLVQQAEERLAAARRLEKSIQGQTNMMAQLSKGGSGQDGAGELAKRCLAADVMLTICAKPPWGEAHLTLDSVVIGRTVHTMWPQVKQVGGWRPSDPYPDHPSGRAVDVMMPTQGHSAESQRLGEEIATYFQKHAAEYGLYYILWRQRIWKATDPVGQWSPMSDRGDWTSNHMDHVHISVTNGTSGTAFDALLLAARDEQSPLQ